MPRTHFPGIAIALVFALTGAARAQLPPGVFAGERDFHLAAAGTYQVDPAHTAVIAKIPHIGYALSVFRFDKVAGALTWNPATPTKSSLTATVETASISTPVPGFAAELGGDKYLRSVQFPNATFVSTRFRSRDATHGKVDGQLTLMGKTAPLTFDVEFMGAGKGFGGRSRIGVEATTKFDPRVFGLPPMLGPAAWLVIDAEFVAAPSVE
jgi:polyisoprenoid-binding protein YceI